VVRALGEDDLRCELSATPATSAILGKADQVLSVSERHVTPRALVELLESLPEAQLPARFAASVNEGDVLIELPKHGPRVDRVHLAESLEAALGVPVKVGETDSDSRAGRRLRADLHELTFTKEVVS
jgi:hypothetical protein